MQILFIHLNVKYELNMDHEPKYIRVRYCSYLFTTICLPFALAPLAQPMHRFCKGDNSVGYVAIFVYHWRAAWQQIQIFQSGIKAVWLVTNLLYLNMRVQWV